MINKELYLATGKIPEYVITFMNGSSVYKRLYVKKGKPVAQPSDPPYRMDTLLVGGI